MTTYSNINYDSLIQTGKLKFNDNVENQVISYTYNLTNIIPNPLYNNYINNKFDDDLYITSDFNGIENTAYLKYSQTNIVNNIEKDMYLPSIGELGIAIENISLINEKIREVCYNYPEVFGEYSSYSNSSYSYSYHNYIISYNTSIPSSTLYSENDIIHNIYELENNINNVWCIDTEYGKISYLPTTTQFNILPFYVYK